MGKVNFTQHQIVAFRLSSFLTSCCCPWKCLACRFLRWRQVAASRIMLWPSFTFMELLDPEQVDWAVCHLEEHALIRNFKNKTLNFLLSLLHWLTQLFSWKLCGGCVFEKIKEPLILKSCWIIKGLHECHSHHLLFKDMALDIPCTTVKRQSGFL